MSVYPHTARILAEEIALRAFPKGPDLGSNTTQFLKDLEEWSNEQRSKLAVDIENHLNQFACRAASVAGLEDPTKIENLVWYKKDGWGHGGCAIGWQERAGELEKDLVGQLDDARKALEDILCAKYANLTAEERLEKIHKLIADYVKEL